MAASTPKKAVPRKAAGKAPEPNPVAEKIAAFDALRDRARGSTLQVLTPASDDPFRLGPEDGFDPPLVVEWPQDLPTKIGLEATARVGNIVPFLQLLLGDRDLMRVVAAFSRFADGERLLVGLYLRIMEHFFGPGAGDVPGGTPAS
ncbi:hypothetical protein [Nocardia transvalensis]|uniref:hypothetical protein n=1 Tax=Nocardia transvalensis TaxID=37333 RepID=UPI0018937B7C|nr:hypothetical protein [Nocardia transvalensis]MBF6328731.1 hypothetical protein [Nocardia transvalensis]